MGLTSAKNTREEWFICCFPSSFLTSSFSTACSSLLISALDLLNRSLNQAGTLWLITQMLPNYSDMFSKRYLRQDRQSSAGFPLYLKMAILGHLLTGLMKSIGGQKEFFKEMYSSWKVEREAFD